MGATPRAPESARLAIIGLNSLGVALWRSQPAASLAKHAFLLVSYRPLAHCLHVIAFHASRPQTGRAPVGTRAARLGP